MKARTNSWWSTVAFLVLVTTLIWWQWLRTDKTTEKAADDQTASRANRSLVSKPVVSSGTTKIQTNVTAQSAMPDLDPSRIVQLQSGISEKNVPISFWGRVIDQNDNPIPDVHVVMSIRRWIFVAPLDADSHFTKTEVSTDEYGRFQLLEGNGDHLSIDVVEKDGYRLSRKTVKSYSYGESPQPFLPNRNEPVVVRMWKLSSTEKLKNFHFSRMIPYDGTSVWIDLREGRIADGSEGMGDLKITLTRNPRDISFTSREPFDWQATIEAPLGGLVASADEFMYLAPADGYQRRLGIDMPKTDTNWTPIKTISFFVKTRDGSYGRITVDFRANYAGPKTGFTLDATINPGGSRNLQP